jgi:hypothetical protein
MKFDDLAAMIRLASSRGFSMAELLSLIQYFVRIALPTTVWISTITETQQSASNPASKVAQQQPQPLQQQHPMPTQGQTSDSAYQQLSGQPPKPQVICPHSVNLPVYVQSAAGGIGNLTASPESVMPQDPTAVNANPDGNGNVNIYTIAHGDANANTGTNAGGSAERRSSGQSESTNLTTTNSGGSHKGGAKTGKKMTASERAERRREINRGSATRSRQRIRKTIAELEAKTQYYELQLRKVSLLFPCSNQPASGC